MEESEYVLIEREQLDKAFRRAITIGAVLGAALVGFFWLLFECSKGILS